MRRQQIPHKQIKNHQIILKQTTTSKFSVEAISNKQQHLKKISQQVVNPLKFNCQDNNNNKI